MGDHCIGPLLHVHGSLHQLHLHGLRAQRLICWSSLPNLLLPAVERLHGHWSMCGHRRRCATVGGWRGRGGGCLLTFAMTGPTCCFLTALTAAAFTQRVCPYLVAVKSVCVAVQATGQASVFILLYL